jgi:Ice-binding-like
MLRQWLGASGAAASGALLVFISPMLAASGSGPILGSAHPYAVLSSSGVSNRGSSVIYGVIGTSDGGVPGFPPGIAFPGVIHVADLAATDAARDAVAGARRLAQLRSIPLPSAEGNLGGLNLAPGVYSVNGSARLRGTLHLNMRGVDPALFVFQIGRNLSTAPNASIVAEDGDRIYWQVGGSVTLERGTSFAGSILAAQNVVVGKRASIRCGRAISLDGKVTLDSAYISTTCEEDELPGPAISGSGIVGFLYYPSRGLSPAPPITGSPEPAAFWLTVAGLSVLLGRAWLTRPRKSPHLHQLSTRS